MAVVLDGDAAEAAAGEAAEAPEAVQDDMTARDSCFSTTTALAFMATSVLPVRPPNRNSAIAASPDVRRQRDQQQPEARWPAPAR